MSQLQIVAARPSDLTRYIDRLEEIASWLESRSIVQWRSGFISRGERHVRFPQGTYPLALYEKPIGGGRS